MDNLQWTQKKEKLCLDTRFVYGILNCHVVNFYEIQDLLSG